MDDPRDAFLSEFHARNPGITARALGRGRTDGGGSSYDLLADRVERGHRVVDLGCGDGHLLALLRRRGHAGGLLTGIDASAAELTQARARPELADVDLRCERGELTSLADASADVVLSHLAFTLFSRPADVLREVARVLRPGGRFSTIVGGGPVAPVVPLPDGAPPAVDAFALFPSLARDDLRAAAHQTPPLVPRLGDSRTHTGDRLRDLLPEAYAAEVSDERFEIACDGAFDDVWLVVSSSYEAAALPEARLAELRDELRARAARNPDGTYRCRMAVRLLSVERT